jgi:hypothetical protein
MNITMQLDLPEELAAKARARGLLNPAQVALLIAREIGGDTDDRDLLPISHDIRSVPDEPVSLDEIERIVDEARAEHPQG